MGFNTDKSVYALDTSALVNFGYNYEHRIITIVEGIVSLCINGQVKTIDIVYDELKRHHEEVYNLLKPHKRQMTFFIYTQEVIDWNEKILVRWPKLIKNTGNPADSLLIAMSKVFGYTVVSDETERQKKNRKIPLVCRELKVPHLSGDDFLKTVGLVKQA